MNSRFFSLRIHYVPLVAGMFLAALGYAVGAAYADDESGDSIVELMLDSTDAGGDTTVAGEGIRPADGESASAEPSSAGVLDTAKEPDQDTALAALDSAQPVVVPMSRKGQGIVVTTPYDDCIVLINGKVVGQGKKVYAECIQGSHTVAGRRDDCFDDIEDVTVRRGEIAEVAVNPRVLRFFLAPPLYSVMINPDITWHGIQLSAGVWYKRHLFTGFVAAGSNDAASWLDSANIRAYGSSRMMLSGLHYLFSAVGNQYAQLCLGLTFAGGVRTDIINYYRHTDTLFYDDGRNGLRQDTVNADIYQYSSMINEFIALGPRIGVQAGWEHFKFLATGSYCIRSDTRGVIADRRNFYLLQAGIAWVF